MPKTILFYDITFLLKIHPVFLSRSERIYEKVIRFRCVRIQHSIFQKNNKSRENIFWHISKTPAAF